jgi:hypothetical protein
MTHYFSNLYSPRSQAATMTPNFSGRLQQLIINGLRILDEAHLHQIQHEGGLQMNGSRDIDWGFSNPQMMMILSQRDRKKRFLSFKGTVSRNF